MGLFIPGYDINKIFLKSRKLINIFKLNVNIIRKHKKGKYLREILLGFHIFLYAIWTAELMPSVILFSKCVLVERFHV